MKTRLKLGWFFLTVLASLSLLPTAHAYYDPAAQRWLNRDPLGEYGGINLYSFVYNTPLRYIDAFGLATICVDQSCTGTDLSAFTYVSEEEPHPEGTPEPPKVPRNLPKPGECVKADAVYEPGKATKVTNCGGGRITCAGGKPSFKYCPCLPNEWRGDGHVWLAGTPPPPPDRRWPSPNIPPYRERPPVQPQPPLNPEKQPEIPPYIPPF